MLRTIRGLALAGLVAVALAAWMVHALGGDVYAQGAFASFVQQFALVTGALLSFTAGLLTLTLTIPRRQRPWSSALLVSLILNGYWPLALNGFWGVLISSFPHLGRVLAESPFVDFIFSGLAASLVLAAPALPALGYTVRTARSVSRAIPNTEEHGSLDITIGPMESEQR
jgi:hypothetical protein